MEWSPGMVSGSGCVLGHRKENNGDEGAALSQLPFPPDLRIATMPDDEAVTFAPDRRVSVKLV